MLITVLIIWFGIICVFFCLNIFKASYIPVHCSRCSAAHCRILILCSSRRLSSWAENPRRRVKSCAEEKEDLPEHMVLEYSRLEGDQAHHMVREHSRAECELHHHMAREDVMALEARGERVVEDRNKHQHNVYMTE